MNVLNVTKNSNMFLLVSQYSNFAIVPFFPDDNACKIPICHEGKLRFVPYIHVYSLHVLNGDITMFKSFQITLDQNSYITSCFSLNHLSESAPSINNSYESITKRVPRVVELPTAR